MNPPVLLWGAVWVQAGPGKPCHLSEVRGVWCESPAHLLDSPTGHRAGNAEKLPFLCFLEQVGGRSEGCSCRMLCFPVHPGQPGCLQEALFSPGGLCLWLTGVGEGSRVCQRKTSQCHLVPAGYHCGMLCCWSSEWGENPLRNENNPPALPWAEPLSFCVPGTHLGWDRDTALSPAAAEWERIQFRLEMCSWRMFLCK